MERRAFIKAGLATAGGLLVSDGLFRALFAAPASDGAARYGMTPDGNGVLLPPGYESRIVARANAPVLGASGLPVGDPGHTFPIWPDGAHAFPADDGGWVLVINSEAPPPPDARIFPTDHLQDAFGGASAIRFDADGNAVDAYWVLRNTQTNCAGGPTPWGTWLSCEEWDNSIRFGDTADAGQVWECDPFDRGGANATVHDALGRFKHEAAAFDDQGRVYLTEDVGDGCLYRFTPAGSAGTPGSLSSGTLEALAGNANGGPVTWVGPIDPSASSASTRVQAASLGATTFSGGEGCAFAPHDSGPGGRVYFTTKGDDKVRALDTAADTLEVVYTPSGTNTALRGVDNVIVSPFTGHVYVAEDGDDMEVVRIEDPTSASPQARPFLKLTGRQHGFVDEDVPTPLPVESEITGLAISPDGSRLYLSSQREAVFGATYEIKAPSGTQF